MSNKALFWCGLVLLLGAIAYLAIRHPGISFGLFALMLGETMIQIAIDEAAKNRGDRSQLSELLQDLDDSLLEEVSRDD